MMSSEGLGHHCCFFNEGTMPDKIPFSKFDHFSCPVSHEPAGNIMLGHGSGGVLTSALIHNVFRKYLHGEGLEQGNDSAVMKIPDNFSRIAVSTDSHIVFPLFFPGGDIGRLAICGTVNDVLTAGAVPAWISAGFILEEGFSIESLERVLVSMRDSADEAGVEIITGDTKVVEKGKGDGIYINTTGIGFVDSVFQPDGRKAEPGDAVILSGTIADHGMAVLCARGDLGISSELKSDTAPLVEMVMNLRRAVPDTHVLRDPTRGGLSTTLNEIAEQSGVSIELEEEAIPILPEAQSMCDMLGFDPYLVANEGKMIIIVPEAEKEIALSAVQGSRYGENAAVIGRVIEKRNAGVILNTMMGTARILDSLPGEMLPRIC